MNLVDTGKRTWLTWLIRIVVVALLAAIAYWVITSVDWNQVGSALSSITVGQMIVLAVLVGARQVFNAAPTAFFVPGLGFGRATVSDLAAATVATVAPPPGDLVVRGAMFRAWGLDLGRAFAGLTLNTVLFYVLRFAAPIFGAIALLLSNRLEDEFVLLILLSGLAAVLTSLAVILVVRSERGAAWVGRTSARLVARFKPEKADEATWAERMRQFRADVAQDLRSRWWAAALALILMLATEAVMFLLAVRFAGVPAEAAATLAIIGAFCLTFPLTALPIGGLGVLDAALYALLMRETGGQYQAEVFAALVIWRVATMLVPLVLGGLTLLLFRRGNAEAMQDAEQQVGGDG